MIIKRLKDIPKLQITGNPTLFKKNLLSNYKLKNCVMFSYSELSYNEKTTIFKHNDIIKYYFILDGECKFTINKKKFFLKKNDSIIIEPNEKYRLENIKRKKNKHIYVGFKI